MNDGGRRRLQLDGPECAGQAEQEPSLELQAPVLHHILATHRELSSIVHVKGHGGSRLTRSAGVRNGPHIWIPNRPPLNVVKTRVPDRLRRGLAQTRPLHLHPDSLDLLPKVWGKQFFRPKLSKKRTRSTRRYYSASSARCRGKSQPFPH